MRVVLSTISKFHTFDVARRLERAGALERLFTGWPRWKLSSEHIPDARVTTFPYLQTIWEALGRIGLERYPGKAELNWQCHQTFDRYVSRHLPACDVLHALAYSGLRSGRATQQRGAVWVCDSPTCHLRHEEDALSAEYDRCGLKFRPIQSRFLEYADESYYESNHIVVGSSFAGTSFLAAGIPETKISVIPYGVDLSTFRQVGVPNPHSFRVLFVGQACLRKGIHDLLDAFDRAAIPRGELQIVGPIRADGAAILGRHQSTSISLVGTVPSSALARYYSSADVLVLPSVCDAFGLVVAQALACGCPVIVSSAAGASKLVADGREGFVVPRRAPDAIAGRLTWLYEHPEQRAAMRQAALARVAALGGWEHHTAQLLELFRRLRHG